MGRLDGQVALVTGGASGMGAAHARILAADGAKVAVCDIDIESGEAVADEIGGGCFELDVGHAEAWTETVAQIEARFGPVGILVNNAGICGLNKVQDTPTQEWHRVMDVNLNGPFYGIRAVVPHMRSLGAGVIVNVSSTAGLTGFAGMSAYTASKWAVRGLTKAAALDLAADNIRVLSLHPALVRTPLAAGVDLTAATARYPIPRPAEPEELARMLLFMVTEATYSTGSEFVADGGSEAG